MYLKEIAFNCTFVYFNLRKFVPRRDSFHKEDNTFPCLPKNENYSIPPTAEACNQYDRRVPFYLRQLYYFTVTAREKASGSRSTF